jgi:hypothetical protein
VSSALTRGSVLADLYEQRRQALTEALNTARNRTAAVVAGGHLDELNVLHDLLADLGVMPPRDGAADEAVPPYDPARPLTRKHRS